MKPHFVDSNIFYYHLVHDRDHGPKATGILRRIRDGEESVTSTVVVSEVAGLFEFRILQTRRRQDLSQSERDGLVKRFEESLSYLYDLLKGLAHLEKLGCTWDETTKAFSYREEYGMDFNDGVNLAIMERNGIEDIYTFDKSFDRVPWVTRRDD